jgi:hypothetical protein
MTGEEMSYDVIDRQAFAEDGGPSLAERASKVRVKGRVLNLRPADKQRLPGWNQLRYRLRGDLGPELSPPMIFLSQFCPDAFRTLSTLQHDDVASKFEDADTEGEDHPPDGMRYGCMSRPRKLPDPAALAKGPKPFSMDWLVQQGWMKNLPPSRSTYRMDK